MFYIIDWANGGSVDTQADLKGIFMTLYIEIGARNEKSYLR